MIDILYLAHGRPEFTDASMKALEWSEEIAAMLVYTDGLKRELFEVAEGWPGKPAWCNHQKHGGPVAILNHFVTEHLGSEFFAKIDNDVIVPPGWLEASLAVMRAHPELDILGLEPPASRTPNPERNGIRVSAPELGMGGSGYARVDSVGGVFVARRRAFEGRPLPVPTGTRGGFTFWQQQQRDLVIGWIVPPLKLFLLDRLPFEPWVSLSQKYIAEGIQRPWTNYEDTPENAAALWGWWKP